jgi:hypothetical protein
MPAPISSNKFTQQLENNFYLIEKMSQAFVQADAALSNLPLGALDNFTVVIDGLNMRFRANDEILINDQSYSTLEPKVKKQAYDRLEKFMKIAIERYNIQYNL